MVRFRHEIARLAVAQAVADHRGQAVHGLVLGALRSLGCDDDARMAFHAEAASDGAAVLRYAAAAARRAARLASHREAAAQYERALRFAASADPVTLAGLHEGLADEVALLDRWDDAEAAGERALALWREAGDRLRRETRCGGYPASGGTCAAVARPSTRPRPPCRLSSRSGPASSSPGPTPPSPTSGCCTPTTTSPSTWPCGPGPWPPGSAPRTCTATHSTPRPPAVRARAWTGRPIRRALDVAPAGSHHHEAGRAYTNLSGIHAGKREFAEAERYLEPRHRVLRRARHHHVRDLPARRARERAGTHKSLGRGRRGEQKILIKVGPSPANRLCSLIRLGVIGARRGKPGVWEYLDEAAATADEAASRRTRYRPGWPAPPDRRGIRSRDDHAETRPSLFCIRSTMALI